LDIVDTGVTNTQSREAGTIGSDDWKLAKENRQQS